MSKFNEFSFLAYWKMFGTFIFLYFSQASIGQCILDQDSPKSSRIESHRIELDYNNATKSIKANHQLRWANPSPDTVHHVLFYMYLNAFSNTESSFIKEARGRVFGQEVTGRTAKEWGWIKIQKVVQDRRDISNNQMYVQPDDGNEQDRTVLKLTLRTPVLPHDTLELDMTFEAKLPRIIARAGYSYEDFAFWNHWFPQPGVFEQDDSGEWAWNCHQFHQKTEFYGEFGTYDVSISADAHLVLGASGCLMQKSTAKGKTTHRYIANDVIDFAWVVYPYFSIVEDHWNDVYLRLLIPPEHEYLSKRYLTAVKQAMEYLDEHVGLYSYPSLTIMDPPLHALRSGLMEYPTFITGGTFYGIPKGVRSLESLAIHEFAHQYFMGILASNEKEEAWLDEGFVTYYEDRILDHYYGDKSSYQDIFGYKMGNAEKSRLEYVGMPNPNIGAIARPGWEFEADSYKTLVYSKTATVLSTIESYLGEDVMDEIIKSYFLKWKFKHPKGADLNNHFTDFLRSNLQDRLLIEDLQEFFKEAIYGISTCDFKVATVRSYKNIRGEGIFENETGEFKHEHGEVLGSYTSEVNVQRIGDLCLPIEVLVEFEDGRTIIEKWTCADANKTFIYKDVLRVSSVVIDPNNKFKMDLDFNNNSYTTDQQNLPLIKYVFKALTWIQNMLQTVGFFV